MRTLAITPDVPPITIHDWWDAPDTAEFLGNWMGWVMTTTEQPELESDRDVAEAARADRPDYGSMSVAELAEFAHSKIPDLRRMFNQHIHQSACATIGPGVIGAVAEGSRRPDVNPQDHRRSRWRRFCRPELRHVGPFTHRRGVAHADCNVRGRHRHVRRQPGGQ